MCWLLSYPLTIILKTTIRSSSSISGANTLAAMWARSESRQKRQHKESPSSMAASTLVVSSISCSSSYSKRWKSATSLPPSMQQMTLIGTQHDPHATEWMDIAITDFIFSNGLPISLVECTKFHKLIQSARHIPPKYTPPYRKKWQDPCWTILINQHMMSRWGLCWKSLKSLALHCLGMVPLSRKYQWWIFWDLVQATHLHCLI